MSNTDKAPAIIRGTIVEFDFAAVDGAELLFAAAKNVLKPLGIALDVRLEAKYLAGETISAGLAALFEAQGVSADAEQVAADLTAAFVQAVDAATEKAVTPGFVSFAKTLAAKGVKVVVATHGNAEKLQELLAKKTGSGAVVAYADAAPATYGANKWDAWRRASHANGLENVFSAAVTGSGLSVKSALVADFAAAAVTNPHVEYQDFGGADVVVEKIDNALASEILAMLHLN